MPIGNLNPKDNAGSVSVRPPHVNQGAGVERWFTDADEGTRVYAQDLNAILAQFRAARAAYTIVDAEGDDDLLRKLLAAVDAPRGNLLANPSFEIWQAGVGQIGTAGTSAYAHADMWKVRGGSGNYYTRQPGFSGARYCMRVETAAGNVGTSTTRIGQALPRSLARHLAGKKVVVSADIRAGDGFTAAGIILEVVWGTSAALEAMNISLPGSSAFLTGGGGSGGALIEPISTGSRRVIWPAIEIPATVTHVGVILRYTGVGMTPANCYAEITNVKLEICDRATAFVPPDPSVEWGRALRYYQKSFNSDVAPVQNAGSGSGEFRFPALVGGANANRFGSIQLVPMTSPPAITLFNPAAANGQVRDMTGALDCSATAVTDISERGFQVTCTGNAGTAAANALGIHWVADARNY